MQTWREVILGTCLFTKGERVSVSSGETKSSVWRLSQGFVTIILLDEDNTGFLTEVELTPGDL